MFSFFLGLLTNHFVIYILDDQNKKLTYRYLRLNLKNTLTYYLRYSYE